MKKTIFFAAMLTAASMFGVDPNQKSTTNIQDDFTAKIWSNWHGSKVKAKYSHNKTDGSAAKGAAQITVTGKGSALFLKRYSVEPSSLYQAEVMVKSAAKNSTASLSAQNFGMNKKFVNVIGGQTAGISDNWQKINYFFRTSAQTQTVQMLLTFNTPEGGICLFDDFKMTKVDGIDEFFDTFAANSWGNWKSSKAKMTFTHDPAVGKKAPGSLKIAQLANSAGSGVATKHIPVMPGKTYTLTVFVKAKDLDPNTKLSLSFQAQDQNLKFLGLTIPSRAFLAAECADWKQIILTYKVPNTGRWEKCRTLLVTLGVGTSKTPGAAWFDDFEFFVEETEEE